MIIALNNKSNLDKKDMDKYIEDIKTIKTSHQLIVCPSFINIPLLNISNICLGAQNISSTDNGAYTGEISGEQLKSYGVDYCIIGHSERREYEKESLEDIKQKIKKALENDIIPILCIGETLNQRENNFVYKVLEEELLSATEDLKEEEKAKIIIAYEPIWSIGTGIIPTNKEIEDVFQFIKQNMPKSKVLYGGSANEQNIETLKRIPIIDGYLLGGLSLKIEKLKLFIEKLD